VEKAHILKVLEGVGGHKKRAAEILDINPSTLYRKLLRYGVQSPGGELDKMDGELDESRLGETSAEDAAAVGQAPAAEEPVLV